MNREELLQKAQKAFEKAGDNPWTPEQKAAYSQGRKMLSRLAQEELKNELAVKLLPAPYKAEKRALWTFGVKIQAVPWKEFFKKEKNEMVVFRIIPHANVANNNKALWKAIYQMYNMYYSASSRRVGEWWKFTYREKDSLWFDVIFKQEGEQKKVEFYVSTTEYQAQKLKRKLENKMNATIKEASIDALQVPKENTIIQEMRYLKHDIFSLNTNTQDTKTPISGIMNVTDDLTYDGDFLRLSLNMEVESRQKWIKNASWAHEKMQKGKVPQRATVDGQKILGGAKVALAGIVNEVNSLLTDMFQALTNVFFKSEKQFEKKKVVEKPFSLEDEINTRRVSGTSSEKLNLPVMKVRMRIASHSADRLTRETLAETASLAYTEIAENNELQGFKVRIGSRRYEIIEELNTLRLSVRTKANGNVNLMSTDELAKIALQMPVQELQRRYDFALNTKTRIETDIPEVVQNPKNLHIGWAEYRDKNKIFVGLFAEMKEEFYCGYTFVGKQGSGKDTAIQNFVYEGNTKHNISFVIPDWICQEGHKGMADGIRDLLPPERIIDLDLTNEDYIIPMDLTEVVTKLGRKGGSRFATEMIDFMNLEGLAQSEKYLTEAAKASGGSLKNIKRIIEDEAFRVETIQRLYDEGNIRLADDLLQWGTNDDVANKANAILSRLNRFFGDDTLYDIFSQPPKREVDFEKWMREGKVIIIRMPKRKLGASSATLAHWVTLKVLMTRMLMSKEDQEKHGCFMVFNEPEQVESEGLAKLMGRIGTEGRKERLGSIFAFHHWNKLPQTLQENLQGGGVNQFLFASDYKKNFEVAKERLDPTFTVEEAMKTPKHYAIAILNTKEPLHAFMVHMLPPREERYDNSFLTKRHARMYGRSWESLQSGTYQADEA